MEEYTSHPFIPQHTAAFAYRSHFLFKLKNINVPFSENYDFLPCFTFRVITNLGPPHSDLWLSTILPFSLPPLVITHHSFLSFTPTCCRNAFWWFIESLPYRSTSALIEGAPNFFTWVIRTNFKPVFLLQNLLPHDTQTSTRTGFLKFTTDRDALREGCETPLLAAHCLENTI